MKSLDYLEEKLNIGEIIDTKPIESVQAAISLFGEQRKYSPRNKNEQEKEKDLEAVLKDLASLKLQLEAKDSAHKQALFRLSQNESAVEELLAQLMSSWLEKEVYINECRAYKSRLQEQNLESARIREQLSCVLTELRAAQGEILSLETQLVAAGEAKAEAELWKMQFESMEKNVLEKDEVIASLESQLEKANKREEISRDSAAELKKLESELELQERKNWDQSRYISLLEAEIKQIKHQITIANENSANLEANAEERESKSQAEIVFLQAELQIHKSKIAEAETEAAKLARESEQAKLEIEKSIRDKNSNELEQLSRELENAMHKVGEFRMRAEQAISRAEAAEKAKAILESRIKRWRELKEKRKQAIAALREDAISRENLKNFEYDSPVNSPSPVQPLGKVLKMKI